MAIAKDQTKHWDRVVEMTGDFKVVMLTTLARDGAPHCRPMYVAERTDDGRLTFVTRYETGKVDEILGSDTALVSVQSGTRYVVLSGRAHLSRQSERIRALWQKPWRVWFSAGPDDPALALIDFFPTEGEYWDLSGTAGFRFAWEAMRAYATGSSIASRALAHGHAKSR